MIYKLLIYILIILILLMLYLGSYNLVEGNTCMNPEGISGLLNTISCSNNANRNNESTAFTDISSICVNNADNTKNNIVRYGGLGNPASDILNSSGQLLSNAANARGLC